MQLSKFGQKFTAQSGILQLMDDLGASLASDRNFLMLGGGNPAQIPAVQAHFRRRVETLLANAGGLERAIGNYSPPQGDAEFTAALADLLRREYGWDVHAGNIALTNGSQTSFFILFNLLAGEFDGGRRKKILLPLAPEYIGYADVGLSDEFFVTRKPEIEFLDEHTFKYHVDFHGLEIGEEIGAICVSRPTNPTGNVLTDEEIARLSELARAHNVPLIIDNAYGTPFPQIIFTEAKPVWDEHIIVCMSLSKLGLPATRTGIVIASEEVIAAVTAVNAITCLSPGGLGAALTLEMVRTGEILTLSRELIQPYYRRKAEQAVDQLWEELDGVDFFIHKPEGAIFLWLWFRGLPIHSQALYERLKARDVLVIPGHHFFPGLKEEWQHRYECLRVSYAQAEEVVQEGLHRLAQTVKEIYAQQGM
ncbi:MAG: valine--pyruvate transaminase [Caldilineae bacterium]|nr:MAG: valine--pyruvate transaminase [Caldilineae bacterium]